MTIKHIRIFVTVYQEESITRAAEQLGMTQPATSLAIRELETHYQTKLFERSGRGFRQAENRLQYQYWLLYHAAANQPLFQTIP